LSNSGDSRRCDLSEIIVSGLGVLARSKASKSTVFPALFLPVMRFIVLKPEIEVFSKHLKFSIEISLIIVFADLTEHYKIF